MTAEVAAGPHGRMARVVTTDVGVLDKVMSILALFDDRTDMLEPVAVARATGMSTPTAYRLMKAMTAHGLLTPGPRGYGLGLSLLHLGQLASLRLDIVSVARPHMVALRDECNETVELQVRVGSTRVPVHLETSTRTVRAAAQVGVPLPLHKGASSRPLLAWLPEQEVLTLTRASAAASGVDLDEDDPLVDEWVVVLPSPTRPAVLAATDLRQPSATEMDRDFTCATSSDPAVVAACAELLAAARVR